MSSSVSVEEEVQVLLEIQSIESSEEPPMEEWSSIICMQEPEELGELRSDLGSGEICAKCLPLSDSSIFRHPYYAYPAVTDPGIEHALLEPEEKIIFDENGQDLYLALCKEMNQVPVGIFHRKLLDPVIDLKFYCVDPRGVRAMTIALKFNRYVKCLGFGDNFLNYDACFHLADMLLTNFTITELNLEGTRIGPEGAKPIFACLETNRTLQILNLNRCEIGDLGGQYLAATISKGIACNRFLLSYNQLGGKTAVALAEAIEFRNTLEQLDLSWNNFFGPMGIILFLTRLAENDQLKELDLSWNNIGDRRIMVGIRNVLFAPNLISLNLSNNRIKEDLLEILLTDLTKAKKLQTLNLSHNPLTILDAQKVISKMSLRSCKIQNLFLDNINVNARFLEILDKIKGMKAKKSAVVTYGKVIGEWKARVPDLREIVLNRANFLGNRPKKVKNKVNVGLIFLAINKENINNPLMNYKEFEETVKSLGATMLDTELIEEIVNAFSGPKVKKQKTINLTRLADYVARKWPDVKLPPTPPPAPEPEPLPTPPRSDKKGAPTPPNKKGTPTPKGKKK